MGLKRILLNCGILGMGADSGPLRERPMLLSGYLGPLESWTGLQSWPLKQWLLHLASSQYPSLFIASLISRTNQEALSIPPTLLEREKTLQNITSNISMGNESGFIFKNASSAEQCTTLEKQHSNYTSCWINSFGVFSLPMPWDLLSFPKIERNRMED